MESFKRRKWLISIRENEGKVQQEVADNAGIQRGYYAMIEVGRRSPAPKVAKLISDALNFGRYGLDWTIFFASDVSECYIAREG